MFFFAICFADSFVLCCSACWAPSSLPRKLLSGVDRHDASPCSSKLFVYGKLIPVTGVQHSTGQLRKRKSGNPGGAKASEQGESITFADVAGVDEAKEELEEIVVCQAVHGFIYYTNES